MQWILKVNKKIALVLTKGDNHQREMVIINNVEYWKKIGAINLVIKFIDYSCDYLPYY